MSSLEDRRRHHWEPPRPSPIYSLRKRVRGFCEVYQCFKGLKDAINRSLKRQRLNGSRVGAPTYWYYRRRDGVLRKTSVTSQAFPKTKVIHVWQQRQIGMTTQRIEWPVPKPKRS